MRSDVRTTRGAARTLRFLKWQSSFPLKGEMGLSLEAFLIFKLIRFACFSLLNITRLSETGIEWGLTTSGDDWTFN